MAQRAPEPPERSEQRVAVRRLQRRRHNADGASKRVADDNDFAVLPPHSPDALRDGRTPLGVLPVGEADDFGAETGQQRRVDRPSGSGEGSGKRSHIGGRAGKPMHEHCAAYGLTVRGKPERLMPSLGE